MADKIIAGKPTQLPACIVPVPLHWSRQLSRGFNQSTLLAAQVRARLLRHYKLGRRELPIADRLLRRRLRTLSQVTQDIDGRQGNVRDAFELRSSVQVPSSVAIVDDVVTTGATVNEIAHLLKRAGVGRVEVWAAARTP
ncbi:MAG: ComF family protein [Pseudomonadales bacterium]